MEAYAQRKYIDATHSESVDTRSRDVEYNIFQVSDADTARAILLRDSDPSEGSLVRSGISGLRPVSANTWEAVVQYTPFVGGLPDPEGVDFQGRDATFQFETGGGRRRVLKSLRRNGVYVKDGKPALNPELLSLINATSEAGVEGVEIESSIYSFSISKSYSDGELPSSYIQTLYRMTNKKNSSPMTCNADGIVTTFQTGELLFKGASGSRSDSDGKWKITYNFAAQENLVILLDGFASFEAQGWDYLEYKTIPKLVGEPGNQIPIREVIAAIVHETYIAGDLNQLGI